MADAKKNLQSGGKTSSPQKPVIKNSPAQITVSGSGYTIAKLGDGEVAFSNRGFVWREIPKEFNGWSFTRVAGGGKRAIRVEPITSGVVFVATNMQSDDAQWKQTPNWSFYYSDGGKSRLFVYALQVTKGTAIDIHQSAGWIGTIVLVPPERK